MAAVNAPPPTPTLTSTQATILLFGYSNYSNYVRWQVHIGEEGMADLYEASTWDTLKSQIGRAPYGRLPEALHYSCFMSWLNATGRLYPVSDVALVSPLPFASRCHHALHPSIDASDAIPNCPICVISHCIGSLQRIWTISRMLGGPYYNTVKVQDRPVYLKARQLWRMAKTRWANLVMIYQELALEEKQWEEAEMEGSRFTPEDLQSARSFAKALQLARRCPGLVDGDDGEHAFEPLQPLWIPSPSTTHVSESIPLNSPPRILSEDDSSESLVFAPDDEHLPDAPLETHLDTPMDIDDTPSSSPLSSISSDFTPSTPPRPPSSPSSRSPPRFHWKKNVAFAADTAEHAPRPRSNYSRDSACYEEGRYACPTRDGWEDTSFMNDVTYPFSLERREREDLQSRLAGDMSQPSGQDSSFPTASFLGRNDVWETIEQGPFLGGWEAELESSSEDSEDSGDSEDSEDSDASMASRLGARDHCVSGARFSEHLDGFINYLGLTETLVEHIKRLDTEVSISTREGGVVGSGDADMESLTAEKDDEKSRRPQDLRGISSMNDLEEGGVFADTEERGILDDGEEREIIHGTLTPDTEAKIVRKYIQQKLRGL